MSWFRKLLPKVMTEEKKGVPEGVWSQCPRCQAVLYRSELERNHQVCPKCTHHLPLLARERLDGFLDPEGRTLLAEDVQARDLLKFRDSKKYKDRLHAAQKKTGEQEALVVEAGSLKGMPLVAMAFHFGFIGGSMSSGVGRRFMVGLDYALEHRVPLVCFSASGGARMQEGLYSLLQMAKTSAGLARLAEEGIPFISVLTHPTMGGVSASLAMLGDVIVAEPDALIGFSGPRVIEQTIRQTLPEGFQRSEFLLEHGAIDMLVPRHEMRGRVHAVLSHLQSSEAVAPEPDLPVLLPSDDLGAADAGSDA